MEAERGRRAEERRKALAALGRQYRERGVRLVEQGNAGEALLSYARALEIAEGLGDRTFPKELWEDVAAAERRLLPLLDVHPPKDSREKEQLRRFAGPLAARRLPTPSTPKSPGIATSPDGTRYVERIESRGLAGGSLRLRDVKTQEPIGPIVNVPLGAGVSFSADGSTWLVHTRELSHFATRPQASRSANHSPSKAPSDSPRPTESSCSRFPRCNWTKRAGSTSTARVGSATPST